MGKVVNSESGEEVASEHACKDDSDNDAKGDSKANRINTSFEVGASVLNLVDDVKCVLNGGDADRGRPNGCNKAKG